jgi:hypothetical protein
MFNKHLKKCEFRFNNNKKTFINKAILIIKNWLYSIVLFFKLMII